jgi:hypothetical protein
MGGYREFSVPSLPVSPSPGWVTPLSNYRGYLQKNFQKILRKIEVFISYVSKGLLLSVWFRETKGLFPNYWY